MKGGINVRRISVRIDNLELRSCDKHLLTEKDPHNTMEIVKWGGQSCYTVAFFHLDKDYNPSLHYVGQRPLKEPRDIFMDLVELGYQLFDMGVFERVEQEESN